MRNLVHQIEVTYPSTATAHDELGQTKRGVNYFHVSCTTRFIVFQRDFLLKRTRFPFSHGDFQRILTSDFTLEAKHIFTTTSVRFEGNKKLWIYQKNDGVVILKP